jgi:DNA-binding beta-propeller fold protein YncE
MHTRFDRLAAPVALVLVIGAAGAAFGDGAASTARPGVLGGGVTLLPNGWKIAPAGRHLQVGDLPLAMVQSPDGKSLLIATNGYARPAIAVVDLEHEYVRSVVELDHAWLGLAWHPDGKRLFVSGAGNNTVHEMQWIDGKLTRGVDLVLGRPMDRPPEGSNRPEAVSQSFIGGLAVSPDGLRLFAVHVFGRIVSAVDVKTGHVLQNVELPAEPYTCIVSADGSTLFVSLWGGAKVLMFDAKTLEPSGEIAVGEHPNAMALTKDGKRLFVSCANTNAVWAIDVPARRAVEQVVVALFPNAPPGSTPNHVSLSTDEKQLLVANADNNAIAVVNVEKAAASTVAGFIPSGWYPTAAMFSRDGKSLFVLSGKGLASAANPRFRQPIRTTPGGDLQYIGNLLTGTVSILPVPPAATLQALTKVVYQMTPYTDEHLLAPSKAPQNSPIPARVGAPSPIKHVFYVIRENRTYDQILGDMERGNGDPTLAIFGEPVTPNAHALAREFGVFDNFYVDAEVSYDGHAWSTSAYATDVVEKFWPTNYAGRGALYLSEGGAPMRNAFGNLAAPLNGYIWDAAVRKGLTVRSYGEFAHWAEGAAKDRAAGKVAVVPSVPGLEGRISPTYPAWDLGIPDNQRIDVWAREFSEFEKEGTLPALSILRLGGDHTNGTRPDGPTPRAMVAENDLAVGRLVETISKSRYWKESAIFIVEDDAQNGPDHIDAHRSAVFVVSPYAKRRGIDSTLYTTSGVLRTMELILGVPPMSQYDAAATPMYEAFQAAPSLAPFVHVAPRTPIDEKNGPLAPGAQASLLMDFSEPDLAPELDLNEIIWRSVRGTHSTMPPIVRSAWIRKAALAEDDDR